MALWPLPALALLIVVVGRWLPRSVRLIAPALLVACAGSVADTADDAGPPPLRIDTEGTWGPDVPDTRLLRAVHLMPDVPDAALSFNGSGVVVADGASSRFGRVLGTTREREWPYAVSASSGMRSSTTRRHRSASSVSLLGLTPWFLTS